ncbi:MAG TPA: hypothetical protein PKV73_01115 [Agriterribacter sp.]|nr:hypothetical protein [Agriterribacter sp.]
MATTLAQSNLAQKQSSKEKEVDSLNQIVLPDSVSNVFEEEPVKEQTVYNILFKLVKKKKGRTYLDNCCDNVPNPNNKNIPERIWLLNGATSIWESELEHIFKDKERYNRSRRGRDIIFLDGVLRVQSTDKLMIDFLRASRHNVGKRRAGAGKFDFYEYDPQQEQRDRMARQLVKIELVVKAKEMPIEEAKKLAAFLGVGFVDELGQPKSDEGIRTELMVRADSDPATFQKHINSKEVQVSWMVRRALIENKIDVGGADGRIVWANGKGIISRMPSTRKPLEYLTELAMTNSEEGRTFKQQLETLIT